jgi:hypothetical protein
LSFHVARADAFSETTSLEWHFWATRSVATGIALPMELVTSTYFALQGVSSNVTHVREHGFDAAAALSLVFLALFFIPYFAKLSLYLRLEWQWGGPRGWIPVGVTKRRATHSERNSARADAKFDWKLRIAVSISDAMARASHPASFTDLFDSLKLPARHRLYVGHTPRTRLAALDSGFTTRKS